MKYEVSLQGLRSIFPVMGCRMFIGVDEEGRRYRFTLFGTPQQKYVNTLKGLGIQVLESDDSQAVEKEIDLDGKETLKNALAWTPVLGFLNKGRRGEE